MAHKTQDNRKTRADADTEIALAAEHTGKADDRVCQKVVEHDHADEAHGCQTPGEDAVHHDAERQLDHGFHKSGAKTPFEAEGDGSHGDRQHGKQRHGAAKRHFPDLDKAEHGTEGDHERADSQFVRVVFLHVDHSFPGAIKNAPR